MSYESNCQARDGTLESPNLTTAQKNYMEIITQFARLANNVALRHGKFKVEAPDGYEKMIQKVKEDGKDYDQLTNEEKEFYENKYRFEKVASQRIGGGSIILQHLIYEAHRDPEIQRLFKSYIEDVKYIAAQESSKYFDKKNNKQLK